MSFTLETIRESGGDRDFIDGIAIHAGQPIQAEVNGVMTRGRYEASWRGGRIVKRWFYYGAAEPLELTRETPVELDTW